MSMGRNVDFVERSRSSKTVSSASHDGRAPSARVRQNVLAAARDLIAEAGFFGLTVDGLVTRSGISKATIYRWWDNRASVALDMILATAGPPESPGRVGSSEQRLRRFVRSEVCYIGGPAGQVLAGLIADAQRRPEIADTLERRYFSLRRRELTQLLAEALNSGAVDADVDIDFFAEAAFGVIYHRLLFRQGPLDDSFADTLTHQLWHPVAN